MRLNKDWRRGNLVFGFPPYLTLTKDYKTKQIGMLKQDQRGNYAVAYKKIRTAIFLF